MKPQKPFYWIDAFTSEELSGNPCAVILDADDLSSETMLSIAKEMNLSETAFAVQSNKADFGARYFTPAEEIPLAGHPTLSTVRALIAAGRIDPSQTKEITLELKAGVVTVQIGTHLTMAQRKPQFLSTHPREVIADLFSLNPSDLMDQVPVQTVSTGTPQLMVPVKSTTALTSAQLR